MKKIFTLFAFLLFALSVNANTIDTTKVLLHRVSWVDQIGSKEEISKEIKARKALILEYKKDGYVFDKLERTPKGLFMRFVKNT
jgi:hypothetical protein